MASSYLGLPPLSPALRSLAPFLQRADELKDKEPIVAYWCLYYAAQNGIALKAKDNASRDLLLELLSTLEKMKTDIGPNDILDTEAASAAYVENFALKVFNLADNEDRSGNSTRSTAKKFLAAANFLEVLKVFPKTEVTESVEEKVRYSKWKAADIAKAFREGRKPTPGPAGGELQAQTPELELPHVPPPLNLTDSSMTIPAASTSPKHTSSSRSPTQRSPKASSPTTPPALKRTAPSPIIKDMPPQQFTPPRGMLGVDAPSVDPSSPGNWSTVATPGTVTMPDSPSGSVPAQIPALPDSPSAGLSKHRSKQRSGSQSSTGSANSNESSPSSFRKRSGSSASSSPKKVHFLPEIVQSGSGSGSPPRTNGLSHSHSRARSGSGSNTSPTAPDFSHPPPTTHISPPHPPSQIPNSYSTAHPSGPTYFSPPAPPPVASSPYGTVPDPSHVHAHIPPYVPPTGPSAPSAPSHPTSSAPSSATYIPPPDKDVELTPSLVTQAQKHCRYAISSLDYEDIKQARKELRAALALLGANV
ncbi:hypothetical protein D9758_002250 [Tetrapyrgos nigripes]|uniref:DUF605-domain-containing protein n=1 Tax=Tetrapyrgos nigripes TaxID=182062 RepID=A0A8H5LT88_9AGAR|nr:hypothetical protein D9758_002250 [Tetrapyrgos nigripes]